jgi:hypothetical protein
MALALPVFHAGQARAQAMPRPDVEKTTRTGPAASKRGRGQSVEGAKRQVERLMRLSDAELVRWIPERSGFYFVGCPNCKAGTQEGQLSWTFDRPDEVFCRYCEMRFPNEKFPENQVVRVTNPRGEVQEYPCWESPEPPPQAGRSGRAGQGQARAKEGYRYFFRPKTWYLAREYFSRAASDFAFLYQRTGDRAYAHKSAIIIDRFAQLYPGYCAHFDLPFVQKRVFPGSQGHPFPVADYRAARWNWWAYADVPEDLIRAYGLIRDSGEIDATKQRRIENDFFRASVAFVRGFKPSLGNMDPTFLRSLIVAGRTLAEPEYVHAAVDWTGRLVDRQFYADGTWREGSPSYHRQTLGGLDRLVVLLDGYSDPAGYHSPADGSRFDNLNLAGRYPILEKARAFPRLLQYPNGHTVVIHDTWSTDRGGSPSATTGPLLLPAFGHARLGRGRGGDQLQAHLHFSGGYGHQHNDLLSLTLFSDGSERLADLGYTHTKYRSWSISTLSHNTVMVDGREQASGSESEPNDGRLLLYVPGDETFQAIEAGAPRAYPGVVSDYRRMLILIEVSAGRAYVVDLFRVVGGSRHEYAMIGDADNDGALETDLPRTRYGEMLLPPGVRVELPTGESVAGRAGGHNVAYAFVRDVSAAHPSAPWSARFTSEATPRAGVRVHRPVVSGGDVFFARAPSLRRARSDDALVDRFTAPMLVERREGKDLESTFVSVLEPGAGRPFIASTERLTLDKGRPGDLALKITWDGGTDYLLVSGDPAGSLLQAGDLVMEGRLGFVRLRGDAVGRLTLVGGTRLEKGARRLAGAGVVRSEVVDVLRKAKGDALDGLVIADPLPSEGRMKGWTAVVTDPHDFSYGHLIDRLSKHDGRTVIVLDDDPAFEIDAEGKSRQVFFPHRSWTGRNRIEIATVTTEAPADNR